MESSKPQDNRPTVTHNGLVILLGASRFDPAHINPDFLRYNEIVDPSWQVERPVIIESGFSQIDYTNGLSVFAGDAHFRVTQSGESLNLEEIVVPDVVSRYLEVAPWPVEYELILIDWLGAIHLSGDDGRPKFSSLSGLAQTMNFEDITPDMQVRVSYDFPDKAITMYVSELIKENVVSEIHFRIQAQRDVESVSTNERSDFVASVLEKWKDDINDFIELAYKFYFIQEEVENGSL